VLDSQPSRKELNLKSVPGAFPALKQMVSDFEERLEEYALKETPPKGLRQRILRTYLR